MAMRRIALCSLLLVVLGAFAPAPTAGQVDESGVKAAFVRNFLPFVSWPAGRLPDGMPYTVCMLNGGSIARKLIALVARDPGARPVRVRVPTSPADVGDCHVVFVPALESRLLPDITARFPSGGLLIISEDQAAAPEDAAINIAIAGSRVTFDLNLAAAGAQGVTISSKLAGMARRVAGAPVAWGTKP